MGTAHREARRVFWKGGGGWAKYLFWAGARNSHQVNQSYLRLCQSFCHTPDKMPEQAKGAWTPKKVMFTKKLVKSKCMDCPTYCWGASSGTIQPIMLHCRPSLSQIAPPLSKEKEEQKRSSQCSVGSTDLGRTAPSRRTSPEASPR